jgi:hypothetical protein
MYWEEFQARSARICLLACALPAFVVILAAGILFDGPMIVAHLLLGAGSHCVLQTTLLMLRIAAFGTEPLIQMSLEARLTLLAACAALLVFDGFALLLLGNSVVGCVAIGAGFGEVVLVAFLLAVRWWEYT